MLKGIPSVIPPKLLKVRSEIVHAGETAIGDANFSGASLYDNLICMDSQRALEVPDVILGPMPLDQSLREGEALCCDHERHKSRLCKYHSKKGFS